MYILDSMKKTIYSSENLKRIFISTAPDGSYLVNIIQQGCEEPRTMGKYFDAETAKRAIYSLFSAMASSDNAFEMPLQRDIEETESIRDARIKRRGGS